MKKIRTRFAPSPTGNLHIGGARTALFNYAFAKSLGGDFLLRIDDTDSSRNISDSALKVMNDLKWLGINWDHGPDTDGTSKGDDFIYYQSKRTCFYNKYADLLIQNDLAYYCFDDGDSNDLSPWRNTPLDLALKKVKSGDSFCIKFKVPKNKNIIVKDIIRGDINFNTLILPDFVLIRSNGLPTYNFATVIDDHLMNITHVIRGDEHLNNTLPQTLIYNGLNWTPPFFAHLSLILDSAGKKMSKRTGTSSVFDFKNQGFIPQSIINYLSLLGHKPPTGKDVFSLDDLIKNFSLKKINPSPAIFDFTKIQWMNGFYLRNLNTLDLSALLKDFFKDKSIDDYSQLVDLYKNHALTLSDYKKAIDWSLASFDFNLDQDSIDFFKNNPDYSLIIKDYLNWTKGNSDFGVLIQDLKTKGFSNKLIFWTLRIAAIGSPHGPDNLKIVSFIPREILKDRAIFILNAKF